MWGFRIRGRTELGRDRVHHLQLCPEKTRLWSPGPHEGREVPVELQQAAEAREVFPPRKAQGNGATDEGAACGLLWAVALSPL